MATKKKRKSPSWLKRELDKRLYYPAIIFIFLLFVIFAIVYSIPSIGIPIETPIQVYFENIHWNWPNLSKKIHKATPNSINITPDFPSCGQLNEINGNNRCAQHTYTFFIKAGNNNDKTDLQGNPIIHASLDSGVNVVELNPSLDGRTAELPVNTLIYLRFPQTPSNSYNITITPNKGVVETPEKYGIPPSVPSGYIGLLSVVGQGSVTIQIQAKQVQTNILQPSLTPAPTLPISKHQPNKLVVTQSKTSLNITVSNPTVVKKIFDDILQLPVMSGTYNCGVEYVNAPTYTLSFYQDNKLTDTAVLTTSGCRTVTIDSYPARLDNESLSSFDTDFKQATGL